MEIPSNATTTLATTSMLIVCCKSLERVLCSLWMKPQLIERRTTKKRARAQRTRRILAPNPKSPKILFRQSASQQRPLRQIQPPHSNLPPNRPSNQLPNQPRNQHPNQHPNRLQHPLLILREGPQEGPQRRLSTPKPKLSTSHVQTRIHPFLFSRYLFPLWEGSERSLRPRLPLLRLSLSILTTHSILDVREEVSAPLRASKSFRLRRHSTLPCRSLSVTVLACFAAGVTPTLLSLKKPIPPCLNSGT